MYFPVGLPHIFHSQGQTSPSHTHTHFTATSASVYASKDPEASAADGHAAASTPLLASNTSSTVQEEPIEIAHSHDGVYLAVCFPSSIHLWKSFPLIHLSSHTRSEASIREHGHNVHMIWRSDRRVAAVALAKGFVQMLAVDEDNESARTPLYDISFRKGQAPSSGVCLLADVPSRSLKRIGPFSSTASPIPTLGPSITHMVNCRDSVLVASSAGVIERIPWDNPLLDSSKSIALPS